MELTQRQLETIKNFKKYLRLKTPELMIEHCKRKMALPRKDKSKKKRATRDHSVQYYQEIIDYLSS